MKIDIQPYLVSELVVIRPLTPSDFQPVYTAASDPLIWEQHQDKERHTLKGFTKFFNESLVSKGALCILDKKNNSVIGSSRYKIIDPEAEVVEIGWSFLARDYWGGTYNYSVKQLMINYALEQAKGVVFYVDALNFRSQRALLKIGAKKVDPGYGTWVLEEKQGLTYLVQEKIK